MDTKEHEYFDQPGLPKDWALGSHSCNFVSIRGSKKSDSTRGTVILVALCFVAVLGIMLASYIALCSRAMSLSNRAFQADLSKQLAEAGIDEALRAFNKNDWSDWANGSTSADWTLDTTNKRATATISFPSDKFAQGSTATVKVRVDNYDAPVLGSTWNASKNYRINDLVGYNGTWYCCVQDHNNQAPSGLASLAYWAPAPIPWTWRPNSTYYLYDVVNYNGTWYRCTSNHTSPATWNGTNWTTIGSIRLYSASNYHNVGDMVYYPDATTWYRCTAAGTPGSFNATSMISWQYRSTTTYRFNDVVCYYTGGSYNWYRWINAASTSNQAPTNTTYWENALSGGVHTWLSSSINYNIGDVVYYSTTGQWYRCLLSHTSSASLTPANTSYWTNNPALSQSWKAGPYYASNDVISYNGVWYLCILSHSSSASITPTNTSYWIGADTSNTSYIWNRTTAYAANSYRCYDGVWYKCIAANTGQSPNNTAYWTAAWSQSSGITTGASVIYAEAIVALGDGTTNQTQLRALIAPASLFPNAVGAATTLTIDGGTGTIDSYDSTQGTYASQIGTSTNYSAVLAAGTSSGAGTSTLLTIGDGTTVNGYATAPSSSSSPYAPRTSFGSSAVVHGASSPLSPNVDLGQVSRSPYVPTFDPQPTPLATAFGSWNFPYGRSVPTNFSGAATDHTINLGTPGATTPARYYYNGALNIGTGYDILTLNINGPVKLYVNGNLFMRSGGTLKVTSAGSLELHTDTALRTAAGYIGIINETEDPKNLLLISDTSGTTTQQFFSPTPSTNALHGVIYAPNTTATLGVDIRTGVTIYGAVSARLIKFNDEANLHYDTSLRYATFQGIDQPYTVTNWRELSTAEQATMP